jgi:predicted transcriptional regulator
MESLPLFSFRISKELARRLAVEAKRAGLSKTAYVRRALEEVTLQQRMAHLSRQLAAHSAAAQAAMQASLPDGLV